MSQDIKLEGVQLQLQILSFETILSLNLASQDFITTDFSYF